VKFCGPDSKRRQGQLYLWFAAAGKAQTPTAWTSASPTDTKAGSLPATGLFSLELEGETFEFVCMWERWNSVRRASCD